MEESLKAIVISASSGIGEAICKSWAQRGWQVYGTYRTHSPSVDEMDHDFGIQFTHCDLSSVLSIETACQHLKEKCSVWDVLVFSAGQMEPIGPFEKVSFNEWEQSLHVNFLQQMRILHLLLPIRRKKMAQKGPSVLFFAGGGSNGAVVNYSSYAVSKIALTKMCEFLDAEMPDTRFVIVGPGWVKTKIHDATLRAGVEMAGANFHKTEEKLKGSDWVSMDRVVECCTWLATTPSKGVNGRNFSVAHDALASPALELALESDSDMYKLRRNKNSWAPQSKHQP